MNQTRLSPSIKALIISLLLVAVGALIACGGQEQSATALVGGAAQAATVVQVSEVEADLAAMVTVDEATRQQVEDEILASTVRIQMIEYALDDSGNYRQEAGGISHATVIAGRYLLTHNHFRLSLDDLLDGKRREVTVMTTDGQVIVQNAPFGAFDVVAAAPEALLLDFGAFDGRGLFATLGLASAKLDASRVTDLQPGSLVAQLNWNGQIAHVDWVRVNDIREDNGATVLELDNAVEEGASGGGIFYQGAHIANNWARISEINAAGKEIRNYTLAALNSTTVYVTGQQADSAADGLNTLVAQADQGEAPVAATGDFQ